MKVLWVVNTIFPYPAKQLGLNATCYGGWLLGLKNMFASNDKIELAIATIYQGESLKQINDDNEKIVYYLVPGRAKNSFKYDSKIEKYFKQIVEKYNPDLIHIHGSEYNYGLGCMRACPEGKYILSIQGLDKKIAENYFADMSYKDIIKNLTFRDIIKCDNIFNQKNKYMLAGKLEDEMIIRAKNIIGRTTWDRASTFSVCRDLNYYHCNEIIRDVFYERMGSWNIDNIEKNSIYMTQAGYPIKGLHVALKAISELVKKQIDVKLYISGKNIISRESLKDRIKMTGYGNYIRKLINKYNLQNNVIFLGELNQEQVVERMLKSNIVLLSSIVENESNSISEAAILGVPVISSYVGGAIDRMENGISGYVYPFNDHSILAYYIDKLLRDDKLAVKFSEQALKKYEVILDKSTNYSCMVSIYEEVLNSGKN